MQPRPVHAGSEPPHPHWMARDQCEVRYCVLHINPWKCTLYQGPRINPIIREGVGFGHAPASQMAVWGPETLSAVKELFGEGLRPGWQGSLFLGQHFRVSSGILSLPWPSLSPIYSQVQYQMPTPPLGTLTLLSVTYPASYLPYLGSLCAKCSDCQGTTSP